MNTALRNVYGLYVHIPFCDGKCFYCAFYSRPYDRGLVKRYLRALENELTRLGGLKEYSRLNIKTIYFGGGTPSLLSRPELQDLCRIIKENVAFAGLQEWTVEINPGSITADKLTLLAKAGVNRISLGAQSFDDAALKWLGRRHNAADIYEAARMIKSVGLRNFGLDLIACIPGFNPDVWRKTIAAAVALEPKHISVYALTKEEGTQLARQFAIGRANPLGEPPARLPALRSLGEEGPKIGQDRSSSDGSASAGVPTSRRVGTMADKGTPRPTNFKTFAHQVSLLSEDEEIDALDLAEKLLAKEGYKRYEISNYAQPGFECLHNLACWRGEEYIGLGAAAASHVGLKRWTNLPDLEKYLAAVEQGKRPPRATDVLNEKLKQMEKIVFGLRMSEGISDATASICEKTLSALGQQGLVINEGKRWRLTKRGFYLADYVGGELLAIGNAE